MDHVLGLHDILGDGSPLDETNLIRRDQFIHERAQLLVHKTRDDFTGKVTQTNWSQVIECLNIIHFGYKDQACVSYGLWYLVTCKETINHQ